MISSESPRPARRAKHYPHTDAPALPSSGSFTFDLNVQQTIELHSFETKIGYAVYPTTDIRSVVPLLTAALGAAVKEMGGPQPVQGQQLIDAGEKQRDAAKAVPEEDMRGAIKHTWLWPRVGEFFKEHGTSPCISRARLRDRRLNRVVRPHLGRDGYIRIRDRQRSLPVDRDVRRPNAMG